MRYSIQKPMQKKLRPKKSCWGERSLMVEVKGRWKREHTESGLHYRLAHCETPGVFAPTRSGLVSKPSRSNSFLWEPTPCAQTCLTLLFWISKMFLLPDAYATLLTRVCNVPLHIPQKTWIRSSQLKTRISGSYSSRLPRLLKIAEKLLRLPHTCTF